MPPGNYGQLNYQTHLSAEEYERTYSRLKSKYSKTLVENWTECTDAKKFVHEDLGIASYLILLWKSQFPCTFVDLGCGNGLLVYILTEEGHVGKGIDVRKRKIWDTYPSTTVLEESTVIPSSESIYPEADWLIGNHSDELTAWLPVMAARSNNKCQLFTIPCCPYKLSGMKFQRRKSQLSVYQDFLEYVQEVGETCGFEMSAEKLKIPSTKRICLIGRRKEDADLVAVEKNIQQLLSSECASGVGQLNGTVTKWIGDFKPRVSVEPVRNCSQIPKGIQHEILSAVQTCLLSTERFIALSAERSWNQGGNLPISELVDSLSADLLQNLKAECKGLQTLLKNHHQVFSVSGGMVQLRSPESLRVNSETVRNRKDFKWKQKSCWFHENHPHGCPISEANCSYSHNTDI